MRSYRCAEQNQIRRPEINQAGCHIYALNSLNHSQVSTLMRSLLALKVLVLCILTCNLQAQNLVVGSVPPGMVSQSLNISVSNPATYIDLDCDGSADFSCFQDRKSVV